MLNFLALLLVCQLAGEVLQKLSGLPLPGPVIGMVLLFVGLVLHGDIPEDLGK
ncbi:MAG: CidA/LrgA family protein, partial [Limibacillus sp.]